MKRLVVAGVLLWAALWPVVHHVLVRRYHLNPWKFGAWAMYAVPTPPVMVALFSKAGGGYRHIDHRSLSAALQQEHRRFEMDRHVWGDLARPDALGQTALRELAALPSVVVMVQHMSLDRDTGLMTSTKSEYAYDRRQMSARR